jgi:Tfp pilus assembly protein PilN
MINLLADVRKDQIRAARTNVILVRYTAIVLAAVLFLLGTLFVSGKILQITEESADAIVADNDIKADVYKETRAEVNELSSKLSDSKSILSQEVRFSQILTKLGQSMPSGAILGSLELTQLAFQGQPVELTAYAKTSDDADAIRNALQSSQLFTDISLRGTDESDGITGYPVKVMLSAQFDQRGIQ